ncbi:MAG: molybdopterin-dependent oxidoreductase [Zoogloeaceae bacterium]|nr:molybdopterin-dependent oxidoreductase [Zoogloeaceae bacterium]
MKRTQQRARGTVVLAQEHRFELIDEEHRRWLCELAPSVPVGPDELRALADRGAQVEIVFEESDKERGALVSALHPATDGASPVRARPGHVRDVLSAFWRNWSLRRQLFGADAQRDAARSEWSEQIAARTDRSDRVGTSICPFCAVGCAQLMHAREGRLIQVEGDPRSPVNRGTLCPKGAGTFDLMTSPLRISTVMYRAPYSDRWEERPLDWAMDRIARLTKKARDESFVAREPDGSPLNHTLALASLGGATLDNEENYLIKKLFCGGLGMVWIENQARICHSSSVPSLGATYGRGASTLAQWDLANSDWIMVMGSNMAENHPITFRFVMQAKEKGAKLIHVDPRFTRTSALANLRVTIRSGTDIAFLGGLIHHILEHDLWFREYALHYTNLATIITDEYRDAEDGDGLFSGWDPETRTYTHETWRYSSGMVQPPLAEKHVETAEPLSETAVRLDMPPEQDETLQHPNCVYQILRRHYARYTPEMVERITGCPAATLVKVARTLAGNSGPERTGAIAYAVAWTHHTNGVQMIRAAGILQALLGNTGRPGGGIIALRGHCSIQGSTDIPTLYDMLPGYLPQPKAGKPHDSFKSYCESETSPTGWWHNFPKYIVSLMRAWYGDAARADNGWCFDWVPRIVGDHSQLPLTAAMKDGKIRGLFLLGQNPAIGGSNSANIVQPGLAELDWLVVRDTSEIECASFWKNSEAVQAAGLTPDRIRTEVFLMPAALAGEKAGTFTNEHRLVQWHDHVVDAPGDSRSELWFVYHLGKRLKALYADSGRVEDDPIRALTWDYPEMDTRGEPDAEAVLREINGYTLPDRKQLASFKHLQADGSTACGCWAYSGIFPADGDNRSRARQADPPDGPGTHLNWAFAWPANRRTMYNRASADPEGRPWSERKKLVWWNEQQREWEGHDEVDFDETKEPGHTPKHEDGPRGMDAHAGHHPFVMMADGKAALFSPAGLKDAPLPTHYEPMESPVPNLLYPQQRANPAAVRFEREDNPYHPSPDPEHPHVLTTYRLTEHHTGGAPTRGSPLLAELQPEGFCEIPVELAEELGVRTRDWVTISTARGAVETRALVTRRLVPLVIDGRRIYEVGMPWHFGFEGYATGDIANVLTSLVMDPNCSMHEGKAMTCRVEAGRRAGPHPAHAEGVAHA